jgi:hypothetical protein
MSMVMTIRSVTVVPMMKSTSDVDVCPNLISRLMRSIPVHVGKSITHKKKRDQ